MSTGTWLMACLVMAPGTDTTDFWSLNQRDFLIPVKIEAGRRDEIKELILAYSADKGQTWVQHARTESDREGFNFYAPQDGLYYFTIVIVDKKGKMDPVNLREAPARMKILVDTIKPEVRLWAERHGDEVQVRWEIKEANFDPAGFKLSYRASDPVGIWNPLPDVKGTLSGQASFRPPFPGPLSVQLQVQDQAGNTATDQKEVPAAPRGGALLTSTTRPGELPSLTPPGATSGPGIEGPRSLSGVPPVTPPPLPPPERSAPSMSSTASGVSGVNTGTSVVASSMETLPSFPSPAAAPGGGPRPTRDALPPIQFVNTRQVTLEYEVANIGPSRVGSVELYVTRDDGLSWQRSQLAGDINPVVPVSLDAGAPTASVQRSLTVDLPGEGAFGFYLVVKSGAGLGKPPPQNNTPPQMRIYVDTTAPVATLFHPEPDSRQRDTLVLTWTASDRNLAANPITLQWARSPDGIWQTIGTDLPNSGRHAWKLPADVPAKVFLRLIVRDNANNTAVAETAQPILVDLNEPEVKIIRLTGMPR
jgi:hypothetical protein